MTTEIFTNETIFFIDWSTRDPRSVKRYLAGSGDGRVLWWKMNYAAHRLLNPKASIEQTMHSFHSRHHAWTRFARTVVRDVEIVAKIMTSQGGIAAVRGAVALAAKEM